MPTELTPIAAGLDGLVTRVNDAMVRERQFTSSAAHELRTPLAEVRSLLDVRLRWPEDLNSCLGTMEEARAINRRMERLTELLLELARNDQSNIAPHRETLDITSIIDAHFTRARARATERHVDIRMTSSPNLAVSTNRAGLESVLSNLIDNAVEHAPEHSTIQVWSSADRHAVKVSVANAAPTLDPSDLSQLFEPFWRKDRVRTHEVGQKPHLGLGLAISKSIAARLNIELTPSLHEGRLVFTVVLPAATVATPASL